MIKSIRFKNFFSFRDCKVELNNLNALIGINGSGKSNFIKAIKLLKATVTEGALPELILNQWGGFDAVYFAGNDAESEKKIELEFEFDDIVSGNTITNNGEVTISYCIILNKVGSTQNYSISECCKTNAEDTKYLDENNVFFGLLPSGELAFLDKTSGSDYSVNAGSVLSQPFNNEIHSVVFKIREKIKNISVYSAFDTSTNSNIRKPMMASGISTTLLPNGGNLPQIINRMKINNKSFYYKLVSSLQTINPQYNGIDFNLIGNNIELMLDEKGFERSIHVTHISDGTLRFLCLLAIVHNPERGGLVCIDEPEIGLHPDMIREFIDSMSQVSDKTQFIISTHSDHILNNLSVENVLVCEKDDDNATTINTFRDKDFVEWAAQYSTGKLWRDGDLGGNRY